MRIYKNYPSTALRWRGGRDTSFANPLNWQDDFWEQWKVYIFDSAATTGSISMNQFFGCGNLYLNEGLTQDITLSGPNPLIMVAGLANAWQISSPTGTITLDPLSRDLTIQTIYLSAGPVTWNIGTGRTLTHTGSLQDWQTTASIIKQGAGTAVLTGNNTYSGGTTITNGTLVAAGSIRDTGVHTLGSGPIIVGQTGRLRTTSNWATGSEWDTTSVGSITIQPSGIWSIEAVGMTVRNGLIMNGGRIEGTTSHPDWGALQLKSRISAGGNAVSTIAVDTALSGGQIISVEGGSELIHSGGIHDQIDMTSSLQKDGGGTLTLSGTNAYRGNTYITNGTLRVPSSGSMTFRPTANGTTNNVTGTVSGTLDFLGTIRLDLSTATPVIGNGWNLISRSSLSPTSAISPTAVTSVTHGAFTRTSSGSWELVANGTRWIFSESSGTLTIVPTDFELWKTSLQVIGGRNDDDDQDGLTNFTEYAFGLDPKVSRNLNIITSPLHKQEGTFTYIRRRRQLTGLTYSVWHSSNLRDWFEDTLAVESTQPADGDTENVTITLSAPLRGGPRLFVRIRAN